MCPTGGGSGDNVPPGRLTALCHPLDRKTSFHGYRKSTPLSKSVRWLSWGPTALRSLLLLKSDCALSQHGCIYRRCPHLTSASLSPEIKALILPSLPSSPPSVFTTGVIKASHSVSMRLLQPGSSESGKNPNTSSSFLPQKDNPHTSIPKDLHLNINAVNKRIYRCFTGAPWWKVQNLAEKTLLVGRQKNPKQKKKKRFISRQ